MSIKLLVDICPLLRRRTGVGNYIFYLLRELICDKRVDDLVGICGAKILNRQQLLAFLFKEKSSVQEALTLPKSGGVKKVLKHIPYIRELNGYWQSVLLYHRQRRYQDYIFWGGNYVIPQFWHYKSILTIHDLSHIHYPDCHPVDRVRFLNKYLPATVQRATVITVVSSATALDVNKSLGKSLVLPPIFVVSPAVGEHFYNLSVTQEVLICEKYNLPKRFILSVGTFEPRKNLMRLLDAYAGLPEASRRAYPLVLVGEQGWLADNILRRIESVENVRWLGYVPEEDVPYLYKLAHVFVYVSLFEGFGMPILEALSVGTPVITSNRGAMQEAAGGLARLVTPENTEEIRLALAEYITFTNILDDSGMASVAPQHRVTWAARKEDMINILQGMSI